MIVRASCAGRYMYYIVTQADKETTGDDGARERDRERERRWVFARVRLMEATSER